MSWPVMILAMALVVAIALVMRGRPIAAAVIGGPALGIPCYFFVGIQLAHDRGLSRFYSLPFGGERISDSTLLLASAACWSLGFAVALFLAALLLKPSKAKSQTDSIAEAS